MRMTDYKCDEKSLSVRFNKMQRALVNEALERDRIQREKQELIERVKAEVLKEIKIQINNDASPAIKEINKEIKDFLKGK